MRQYTSINASGDELAPDVRAILEATRERPGGETRVSVDAWSFPEAVAETEAVGRIPVIAEVKPTSPAAESVHEDDPVELAREMVAGGATALSVLTELRHFGGSVESLRRIREAVDVPVLRKDFIMNEAQLDVVQSDPVLLIARFVGEDLPALVEAARDRGFQSLVEVHTCEELTVALAVGADIVGISNHDLRKLEVDFGTFEEPTPEALEGVLLVAESGVQTVDDARRICEAGADALFVGTVIIDGDVRQNTETLTQ